MNYALITGGCSGIGLEYVRQLAARNYNIIIISNRDDDNKKVASEIAEKYGVTTIPMYADLCDTNSAQEIFDKIKNQGITVDVLINNAGMLLFSTLERTRSENIDRIVNLHCTTPTKLCRLFFTEMKTRGHGYILIMSSITAWTPYPTISHYAATKSYLSTMGKALWFEAKGSGVGVTMVYPSAVNTPLYNIDNKWRKLALRFGVMSNPDWLAAKGLKAMFKHHRKCIPGVLTKIEVGFIKLMPTFILTTLFKLPVVKRLLARV